MDSPEIIPRQNILHPKDQAKIAALSPLETASKQLLAIYSLEEQAALDRFSHSRRVQGKDIHIRLPQQEGEPPVIFTIDRDCDTLYRFMAITLRAEIVYKDFNTARPEVIGVGKGDAAFILPEADPRDFITSPIIDPDKKLMISEFNTLIGPKRIPGVGSTLLALVMQEAARRGVVHITGLSPDSQARLLPIYLRNGYEACKIDTNAYWKLAKYSSTIENCWVTKDWGEQ